MRTLEIAIGNAVERIRELECRRSMFGGVVSKNQSNILLDGKPIVLPISPKTIDGMVAAVDGGLLHRNFHGFDLIVGKAVGAVFEYKRSRLVSVEYHPSAFPAPTPIPVYKPLSQRDSETMAQIKRQELEIQAAIEIAEGFDLEMLLLDGSVIPHSSTRPHDDSEINEDFHALLGQFKELYSACSKRKLPLVGIVEDSRGKRFGDILSKILPFEMRDEGVLGNTFDTNLLYYILQPGLRTCDFSFSDQPKKHPILRELGEWSSKARTFYMKSAKYDRPLRIDYINGDAEDIVSKLYPLCEINELYGIPSPIIEADARARLSSSEIEVIYNQLVDKAGELPALMRLRRDMRPF
ncbi:MAG: DNA double-strand break repair nuclease NurA [archaeon]